jgi:hypothetical protein
MNNFSKIILLFTIAISIISCSKSSSSTEPLRDYTAQNVTDMTSIENYMKTHYMTVDNSTMDVTFTLLTAGDTTHLSIWDNQLAYPLLTRYVTVTQNSVDVQYKIYYIQLRQGSGATSKSPCNVDRVLTAYRGEYIYSSTDSGTNVTSVLSTQFEESNNPQGFFNLTGVIRGWSEVFPQFKTGSYTGNPDGTVSYNDYGAGVMFLPSGLAYYSNATGSIPAYSPLIFSFKLFEIQRTDQDGDGILSYLEDIGTDAAHPNTPDGYMLTLATDVANVDDTDGDGIPNFLDADDDGDYYTTKSETSYVNPSDPTHTVRYYPYDGAVVDDPLTPYVDERQGVPRKFTGPNNTLGYPTSNDPADFTDPTRLRRYLDATAKPKFADQ